MILFVFSTIRYRFIFSSISLAICWWRIEIKWNVMKSCFRPRFCTVRLYWTRDNLGNQKEIHSCIEIVLTRDQRLHWPLGKMKWNEWCFRPWFCTVRLYWARDTSVKWVFQGLSVIETDSLIHCLLYIHSFMILLYQETSGYTGHWVEQVLFIDLFDYYSRILNL